jgi:hypothetical protein
VISTLCLLLLLGGGTAYAASQLGKESVGTTQLAKGAVTPAKLSKASKATLSGPAGATGPKGEKGATGSIGATGEKGDRGEKGEAGQPTTALWAVVAENGNFVRGKGISETQEVIEGFYEVEFFQHNVSQCDWQATVASPSSQSGVPRATVGVILKTGDPETLMVELTKLSGQPATAPFHIAVFC